MNPLDAEPPDARSAHAPPRGAAYPDGSGRAGTDTVPAPERPDPYGAAPVLPGEPGGSAPRPGGRLARRRAARKARTGAWLTAAIGFTVAVVAVVCVLFVRGGGAPTGSATTAQVSSGSDGARAGGAGCRASAGTAPAATATLPAGPKAASIDVRVTVLNGSGMFGQAEAVLSWMQNHQGYLRTSNGGPASAQAHTSLVYAPAHVDQARTLVAAMRLPASALHATGKDAGPRTPMELTLGQDFRGVGKPLAAPSNGCATEAG